MANTSLRRLVLAGSILLLTAFLALPQAARGEGSTARPRYAPNHDLLLPVGFENWVFVGSNLGLVYDAELPLTTSLEAARAAQQVFHNIYIDPEAYEYFKTNKEFPDPTMLVMDMYSAEERAPRDVLAEGVFNGAHTGLQVAVKDTRRPGPSTTPWPITSSRTSVTRPRSGRRHRHSRTASVSRATWSMPARITSGCSSIPCCGTS